MPLPIYRENERPCKLAGTRERSPKVQIPTEGMLNRENITQEFELNC